MAWAAFCDAYFGVYCLMIAALYVVATIGPPERLFFNVNTPADLAAARVTRIRIFPIRPKQRR